jgi:hypothetical protein
MAGPFLRRHLLFMLSCESINEEEEDHAILPVEN